jgi:hypothetical protein
MPDNLVSLALRILLEVSTRIDFSNAPKEISNPEVVIAFCNTLPAIKSLGEKAIPLGYLDLSSDKKDKEIGKSTLEAEEKDAVEK